MVHDVARRLKSCDGSAKASTVAIDESDLLSECEREKGGVKLGSTLFACDLIVDMFEPTAKMVY